METTEPKITFPKSDRLQKYSHKERPHLPPWLFQHQDIISTLDDAHKVDQDILTNTLNHLHFTEGVILAHLSHPKYEDNLLVETSPEPCLGEELSCRWSDANLPGLALEKYQLNHLIIDDGQFILLIPAMLREINREGFRVQLPSVGYAVGKRRTRRYCCEKISVDFVQNGLMVEGELVDFSPMGFRIRTNSEPSSSYFDYKFDNTVTIKLLRDKQILFSGTCRFIRQQPGAVGREIVMILADMKIKRFRERKYRNKRQKLIPSPTLIFNHPFIRKRVHLEVEDISTSGFSVYENTDEGVLMPGMIIPELTIHFPGSFKMNCLAQVIYRSEENENGIRCGLAILNMDLNTYTRLTDILINAMDSHAHISSEVDMDELWEFFFDTGFIYPKKYNLIASYRERFKETYRRLYQETPEIVRHFTYQKNGRIYSHLAMVRAYENTWLIQHHASKKMGSKQTAITVLRQIMHFLNDIRRMPSAKLDYLISFFRPENRFPDRVFGSFARELKDNNGCSMDLFSYMSFPSSSLVSRLPEGWSLAECSEADWWELKQFYGHFSRGLLMDVISRNHNNSENRSIEEIYASCGFLRKWQVYSMKHEEELIAIMIMNQSDLGLNLSEVLNSIMVIVINRKGLSWDLLSKGISQLAARYNDMRKVPVLLFPEDYVENMGIPYEKQYLLWILNTRYGSQFYEYMQKRFRATYKEQ